MPSRSLEYRMVTSHSAAKHMKTSETDVSALFRPGSIDGLALKNRLVMAAMGNAMVDATGQVNDRVIEYYRARAAGGIGLVITQFASVSGDDLMPNSLHLFGDSFIPGVTRLTRAIHDAGSKVLIQLMHPGMLFLLLASVPAGVSVRVPSVSSRLPGGKSYREVSEQDIERYTLDFGNAARRAREAGADGVELHACHGCLVSSFLSPAINRRTDRFGGNAENRARFARMVVESMRKQAGADFPIVVRLNGSDDIEGGISPDEAVEQAGIFRSAGASAISVSCGIEYWSTMVAPSYLVPDGVMVPVAARIKQATGLPVIVAGKITPGLGATLVGEGRADFVALGRPLLANPALPDDLRDGLTGEHPACVYCNNCMISNWRVRSACTVNPFLYGEASSTLAPSASPKKVMVAGGGLAGMWSALFLKSRGHGVSLYEKGPRLGGQWNIACALPGKERYAAATEYLTSSLERLGVPISLNTEVTRELVQAGKPDMVVVAAGAVPSGLDVPGAAGRNVVQANDVITGQTPTGKRAVVIGGRMLGLETALLLAGQGKEVVLVSRSGLGGRKGPDEKITFRALVRKIVEARIPAYLDVNVVEITVNSVVITMGEEPLALPADTVVLAAGVTPVNRLAQELKGAGPEVYTVGDCAQPGNAAQAAFGAMRLALKV